MDTTLMLLPYARPPVLPRARRVTLQGRYLTPIALLLLLTGPAGAASPEQDLASARTLFEKNLQSIRDKNRETYLSCYLESDRLVRTGPDGFQLGYEGLAATAGEA